LKTKSIIILLVIFSFWSCDKEITESEPIDYSNEFFPIVIGNSITYQIQEITIDKESAVNDTLNYQIKEKIESLIENLDKYKSYRLERYYRKDTLSDWVILNIWQIRQYQRRIHKIEDNIEYLRLLSPVSIYDNWNPNTYNNLDTEDCNIYSIKDTLIDYKNIETAYVTYINQSSLIDKKFSEECYAKTIGLIKKTIIDVELNIDPSEEWENKITKGTIFYQNMINTNE